MNQEKIGKFISEMRKSKNLTQEQLAEKLGVSNKSVSRWENGNTMPDLSILVSLSECLGVSLNELLSGEKIENDDIISESNNNLKTIISLTNNETKTKNKFKILSIWLIIFIIISSFIAYTFYKKVMEEQSLKLREKKIALLTPKQSIDLYKEYKNKSMSDISNTGFLLLSLPLSDIGFNFDVDENNKLLKIEYKMPIGVINNFKEEDNFVEKSMLYNLAAIFLLIEDVDIIEYNFDAGIYASDQFYRFTKKDFLEILNITNIEILDDNENWTDIILNIIKDNELFNDKWNLLNR